MGWLIFLGIVATWAYGFKFFYGVAFRNSYLSWERERKLDAKRYPSLYRWPPSLEDYEKHRDMANLDALFLGIFWPVTWVYFVGRNLVTMKTEPNTPQYVKLKQEKELEDLRKLAREHGLKLPEVLDS